jgi:hypothetical protein
VSTPTIDPPGPPTPPPFPAWRAVLGVLTLALTIVTGLLFTALWNSGWFVQVPREFEPAGLDCVVEIPGAVHESALLLGKQSSGPEYAVRRRFPWESFGLAARDLPDDDGRDLLPPMDAYLRDFFKTLPGAPDPVAQTVRDATYPIRQATATTPKYGNVVARVVYGGPKLYLLVAAGKAVTPTRPDVTRFFDSFRCTDADDLRDVADAFQEFAAAGAERDPSRPPFEARPYGGPAMPDAADFRGLTHRWACDATDATWPDSAGGRLGSWSRPGPARVPGVRAGAIAFGSSRRHVAEWDEPTDLFPGVTSTLAFWYRSTPGVGRLLDFAPAAEGTDVVELNDGSVVMKLRDLPEKVSLTLPGGRDRQARDGNWHHVAVVRRRGTTGPRTEVWLDGFLTHDAATPAAGGSEATSRLAVGGVATLVPDRIGPQGTGFRAALDELCVYSRALDEAEIRRLAAAPERPYWLLPDTGLPKPVLYVSGSAPADGKTSLTDAVTGRSFEVAGEARETDTPAGVGYEITLTRGESMVQLGTLPLPVEPPKKEKALDDSWAAPFTISVWGRCVQDEPIELFGLDKTSLVVGPDGARIVVRNPVRIVTQPVFEHAAPGRDWHHYTLTRSRKSVLKFYVDGTAVTPVAEVIASPDGVPTMVLGRPLKLVDSATVAFGEFVVFPVECTPAQVKRIAGVKVAE